jgi:hypothetical protein
MKYFTPERYLRLGNLQDEASFLAAHRDWERALARYRQHLGKIQDHVPAGLRRLIESVYLHDARVLDIWQGTVSRFTITLQPESDPARLVVLSYSLVAPPSVKRAVLPAEACSEPPAWLYDELDLVKPAGNGGRGNPKGLAGAFVHEILLSNGWEIHLRFRDATVTRPVPLIPATPAPGYNTRASAR